MNQKYALTRPDDRSNKESHGCTQGILYSKQRDRQTLKNRGAEEKETGRGSDISWENENSAATSFSFPADALKSCHPSPHFSLVRHTPYIQHPLCVTVPPPSGARLSPLHDVAPSLSMTCVSMNEPAVGISARIRAYASTKRTRIPCGCTTASLCAWRSRSAPLPLWLSQASFLFSFIFFFFFNTNVYVFRVILFFSFLLDSTEI